MTDGPINYSLPDGFDENITINGVVFEPGKTYQVSQEQWNDLNRIVGGWYTLQRGLTRPPLFRPVKTERMNDRIERKMKERFGDRLVSKVRLKNGKLTIGLQSKEKAPHLYDEHGNFHLGEEYHALPLPEPKPEKIHIIDMDIDSGVVNAAITTEGPAWLPRPKKERDEL